MKLKILRLFIMTLKLSTYGLILQAFFMSVLYAYNGSAQSKRSNEIFISEPIFNYTISETFDLIETRTDFKLFYLEKDIKPNVRIKLKPETNRSVYEILMEVSKQTGLKFRQVNNVISASLISKNDLKNAVDRVSILETIEVSGKITDENNQGLPGATIVVKGTTTGTTTDLEGNYKLAVPENSVLSISFVGYKTLELQVGSENVIDIQMEIDAERLEEIVVVGYGSQKKSVVTAAISSVKAKDLESMPISRIEQALQGRTSGLVVAASSGEPGAGSTVRVRGLTSLNSNDPLWVVDGVVVDNGGIGYLNQSDIASIEVLKDASSQAIYGARGAAGVILVTTKKGQVGSLKVNYNGFYGTSQAARKLDLLNATEYAILANESSLAGGGGVVHNNPLSLGEGTDWQELIFNNSAKRQNHELSISGGNDVSTFYTSFGYWDQEGIVASDISNYKRINLRLNSTHKIKKWLTFGQNLGYARGKSTGIGNTNSEFGGPLSSAINLDPTTPVTITDPDVATSGIYLNSGILKDSNGNPYGISNLVGNEMANPLAYIQTRLGNYSWSDDIIGNMFLEIEPIEGIKVRSTLGAKLSYWGGETFTPEYYLSAVNNTDRNSFNRSNNKRIDWNIENTISYSKNFDKHAFVVLIGQGAYQDNWTTSTNVTKRGIPATSFEDAYLNWNVPTADITAGGSEGQLHTVSSIFSRVNYNFEEKYLFSAVLRRDGSSRFGSNNKYGIFPSISLGWNTSLEEFWPSNEIVNFLKIRGGYGVVGTDNIGDFAYLSTVGGGRNYSFGTAGDFSIGVSPNAPSNPELKWEQTSQLNIGFEATLLGAIDVTFDWYKKTTDDILMNPRIPGYVGAIGNPAANVASVENSGVELELGYEKTFGELKISANGNLSYQKNEVTYLGNGIDFISGGSSFQASTFPITRTAVGHSMNSFYGFERLGIFQTVQDVQNHTNSEGSIIQPNAKPGDFIWADNDDDGQITEEDRTFIGNPTPTWTYGMTINATYKNFDFVIFGQGVAGNEIFQGLTRLDIANANRQTKALGRWTGEGTSTDYPRLVSGDPNNNFGNPSDFYLEKGDYFRVKTLQVGYTLPRSILDKIGVERFRVYLTGENLFTFTKYTGYDPEIGGGTLSIDKGIYPQAKSFMMGVNLTF